MNNLGVHGRWAFAEFTAVYQIQSDLRTIIETLFNTMIATAAAQPVGGRN